MEIRLRRPTTEALAVMVLLSVFRWVGGALWQTDPFVLAAPVARPWTPLTAIFVHIGIVHLASNAVGLLVFGLLVERVTTRRRFFGFLLGVGALAGLVELAVTGLVGEPVAVLGASGAVLGLLGYLLAGNALTNRVVMGLALTARQQALVFGVIAIVLTLATLGPRIAVIGHFTGGVFGLAAGRMRLLHVE